MRRAHPNAAPHAVVAARVEIAVAEVAEVTAVVVAATKRAANSHRN